jgi:heavy metal sensor kinase
MYGEPGARTVNHQQHSYRVLVTSFFHAGQRYSVLLATPLDELNGVVRDFRNLLFALIPAVLLAASVGGYWISRQALAPVDEITRVAKSISVQNLSSRLVVPETGDELQRMSETWNQVLERLEGAITRIRQFTADASHELRTPVTLIRSTAELALRREREPEEYRKALGAIEAEAKRMTELTTSLLTLARTDSDQVDLPLRETDIHAVVAEAVEQSISLAETRGVALVAATTPGPLYAQANEAGLHRILLALIDNALKYTPRGGTVTVRVEREGDRVLVEVLDTGEGIDAGALPHIFDRFYRADAARGTGGAGLGLAIAQAIARGHGTQIEVESTPGSGSRFSLSLPTIQAPLSSNLQMRPVGSIEGILR